MKDLAKDWLCRFAGFVIAAVLVAALAAVGWVECIDGYEWGDDR